jgi:hypothetical protein
MTWSGSPGDDDGVRFYEHSGKSMKQKVKSFIELTPGGGL